MTVHRSSTTASSAMSPLASFTTPGVRPALGWFAVAVIVGMQAGTIFRPLGDVGETRVADWIDLITPFAVVGLGALVMYRAGAELWSWAVFAVGAIAFALGHGLHLAANSISNAPDPVLKHADIVHLWDEVVSHYVWYSGLFLVLVGMATALRRVDVQPGPLGWVLAALFAVTLVNTYIEGAIPWLGLGFLSAGLVAGVAWRPAPLTRLLIPIAGSGLLLLVAWGVSWYLVDGRVFPEFSDVGWI
jgi:hypothetical protein